MQTFKTGYTTTTNHCVRAWNVFSKQRLFSWEKRRALYLQNVPLVSPTCLQVVLGRPCTVVNGLNGTCFLDRAACCGWKLDRWDAETETYSNVPKTGTVTKRGTESIRRAEDFMIILCGFGFMCVALTLVIALTLYNPIGSTKSKSIWSISQSVLYHIVLNFKWFRNYLLKIH